MQIDESKIDYFIKRGYIDIADHTKFKYIVEILRLFNVNVDGGCEEVIYLMKMKG